MKGATDSVMRLVVEREQLLVGLSQYKMSEEDVEGRARSQVVFIKAQTAL